MIMQVGGSMGLVPTGRAAARHPVICSCERKPRHLSCRAFHLLHSRSYDVFS